MTKRVCVVSWIAVAVGCAGEPSEAATAASVCDELAGVVAECGGDAAAFRAGCAASSDPSRGVQTACSSKADADANWYEDGSCTFSYQCGGTTTSCSCASTGPCWGRSGTCTEPDYTQRCVAMCEEDASWIWREFCWGTERDGEWACCGAHERCGS